jgi:rhodanese-related sulfurtransferase
MKKVMLLIAVALVASMFLYAAPLFAEDEGVGDYVSAVAPKGKDARIPPGHFGIIAKYADELLSGPAITKTYWNVIAAPLFDAVDDPVLADQITDFFVIDTRTTAQYCNGHLPMAVNIPVTELAKPYSLAVLPTDKPILLICNSGHNASVATGALRMLGYDAWALRSGMLSVREVTTFPLASATIKQDIYGVNKYKNQTNINVTLPKCTP